MINGYNVDPVHGYLAADVARVGAADAVRTILVAGREALTRQWIKDCHDNDMKILGIVARETKPKPNASADDIATYCTTVFGWSFDWYQIGNESDHTSDSSYTQSQAEINELGRAFKRHMPSVKLIGPGLAAGLPDWARTINWDLFEACAVHPYGRRAGSTPSDDWGFGEVGDLLQAYHDASQKPIWVTEYGVTPQDVTDRAAYYAAMYVRLTQLGYVEGCFPFCWGAEMVPAYEMQSFIKSFASVYAGTSLMSLEDKALSLGLTNQLGPIKRMRVGVRLQAYPKHLLMEVDGQTYVIEN